MKTRSLLPIGFLPFLIAAFLGCESEKSSEFSPSPNDPNRLSYTNNLNDASEQVVDSGVRSVENGTDTAIAAGLSVPADGTLEGDLAWGQPATLTAYYTKSGSSDKLGEASGSSPLKPSTAATEDATWSLNVLNNSGTNVTISYTIVYQP